MSDKTVPEKIEVVSIKVGPRAEKGKVAIWEVHPAHPHKSFETAGEIFLAEGDTGVYRAGLTKLVEDRLRAGAIVQVAEDKTAAPKP